MSTNDLAAALRALKTYRHGEVETGIGMFPEMIEDPNGGYLQHSDVMAAIVSCEGTTLGNEGQLPALDGAEIATILAALRYYQQQGMGDPDNRSDDIHDIATNGDQETSLDDEGIDELCEKLNFAVTA
jgi:hypothetical protein